MWLKQLFSRPRLYGDLSEEIREHLEEKIEELVAGGMSRREAAAVARREFGNVTFVEESSREVWRWPSIENVIMDVRYALRTLRKSPGFTAVVVLTLALGIGANTAIFSLVDTVLLRMLPVREAQQLVEITRPNGGTLSYPFFEGIRDRNQVFSGVLLLSGGQMTASAHCEGAALGDIHLSPVSGSYFEVLGVSPAMGRVLVDEDLNTSNAAVISYGFWQRAFGGEPSVLGKTLRVGADSRAYTIVGVTKKANRRRTECHQSALLGLHSCG